MSCSRGIAVLMAEVEPLGAARSALMETAGPASQERHRRPDEFVALGGFRLADLWEHIREVNSWHDAAVEGIRP